MSVLPVWRPDWDHSVSPWRIRKTRGVVASLSGIVGRLGRWVSYGDLGMVGLRVDEDGVRAIGDNGSCRDFILGGNGRW